MNNENDMNPRQGAPRSIDSSLVSGLAPFRPADGHKGTFGTLLISAGSPGMGGAAIMCCEAGLRSGTGLVRIFSGRELSDPMLNACPQAVFEIRPEEVGDGVSRLKSLVAEADAVVYGPGLDPEGEYMPPELMMLIENTPRLLLDAGAMSIIQKHREPLMNALMRRKASALPAPVLTPHPGEFSRIMPEWDKSDRVRIPGWFASEYGVILVLKGHQTAIFTPAGLWYINTVGNDGLAKGGSGDVLAGLIGGFMAQGIEPETAAVAGVYFHGLSGDITAGRLGRRYMQPTDLLGGLSEAFRECGWQ
jgi:NAD(P)H-hydrate epimerase